MTDSAEAAAGKSGLAGGRPQRVKVIISGGFQRAYEVLIPEFQHLTGITVETGSGASEGTGPKTIAHQLTHGAKADMVILSREGLGRLLCEGLILEGSDAGLATAPLAAAVRAGRAMIDIGSAEQFRDAVIEAKRIVAPGSTSGQFVRDRVFPKLALPEAVVLTLVGRGTDSAAALLAGEHDLAIGPTSELMNLPGLELLGPLPDDLQLIQTFTAAIVKDAENPAGAKRLIDFLTTDSGQRNVVLEWAGMRPASLT